MKNLKNKIIDVLSVSSKSLMAKEIAKLIGGVDKTQINPTEGQKSPADFEKILGLTSG